MNQVKVMRKAPAQQEVPSEVGRSLNDLMKSVEELREYEAAVREARWKAEDAKQESIKVLVEYRMFDCLSINMAAVRKLAL